MEILGVVGPDVIKSAWIAIAIGAAGGFVLNLDKIKSLESLKHTDPYLIVRNLILGGAGGWLTFGSGITHPTLIFFGGFLGEMVLEAATVIGWKALPFSKVPEPERMSLQTKP